MTTGDWPKVQSPVIIWVISLQRTVFKELPGGTFDAEKWSGEI